MKATFETMIPAIEKWPVEDQEALVEAARAIEARRAGVCHASSDELAAIDRGLEDAAEGRFASEERLAAALARFREP
jgi:predicted transcriptional regulator